MGQVASAGDNAAMESFFALLQKNVLNRRRWGTRHELRLAGHHLDRTDVSPPPPPSPPRTIDPYRVRDHHDHTGH
jgi:hypothetical protein